MKKILSIFTAALMSSGAFASVAKIGQAAPDFSLQDTNGKGHALNTLKGKTVVLEWLNHDCPYVKKHYESGNMQKLQKDYTAKGVVWLSVNSSAPGKQGNYSPEKSNELSKQKGSAATAVLLDPTGSVGRAYGAKTTPHMYIIDKNGILVYDGALDDKPTTEQGDPKTAKNYVAAALDEILAGKKVTTASSKPYGCSVKY